MGYQLTFMTKWQCTYDQINRIFIYYTLSPGGSSISALIPDIKWWHQESWGICQSEIHGSEGQSGEQLHHERVWPFAICGEIPYMRCCRHRWHYGRTYQTGQIYAPYNCHLQHVDIVLPIWNCRLFYPRTTHSSSKKKHINPTMPKHYRPIVILTTF